MKAARLAELVAAARETPEGVAVRIDAKELLWLLTSRHQLALACADAAYAADKSSRAIANALSLGSPS